MTKKDYVGEQDYFGGYRPARGKKIIIPGCSNCGEHETYVNAQAAGPAQMVYDSEGEYQEALTDDFYYRESKTVRCFGCGKIRRGLFIDLEGDHKIKVKDD